MRIGNDIGDFAAKLRGPDQVLCRGRGGDGHPGLAVRLRALVLLMRVQAPRTVDKQWSTLQRLRAQIPDGPFADVLAELHERFAPTAIDDALERTALVARFASTTELQWFVRAAGVTRHRGALTRLTELSVVKNLHTSLAAERSLEDFDGPAANAALATCTKRWAYDVGMRAGWTLARRDPELLRAVLTAPDFPTTHAYKRGLLLASIDDARSVPILCATVAKIAIVDHEMFDQIERLAERDHLSLVDALPEQVRSEQRDRAASVAGSVRKRLGR